MPMFAETSQSLLQFILNLMRDDDAAAAFAADPQAALAAAGFEGLTGDDVDCVLPMVLDYAPVSFDREYNTGGNVVGNIGGGHSGGGGHGGGGHGGGGHGGGGHGGGGHGGGGK